MCGIFGMVRSLNGSPDLTASVFRALGEHAVERGQDSAGFALTDPRVDVSAAEAKTKHMDSIHTFIDGVHIIKDTVPFHELWNPQMHHELVAEHRVAVGHTRWATQGKKDSLTNASPLAVGTLVGTHNGDLDKYSVPGRGRLPQSIGSTDTEVLYRALNRDRYDRRKIVDVLKGVEGRAALAWFDRRRPDRVYLSRAALSPLAFAWDSEGNFYWASNPRWFREIEKAFGNFIGFRDITLMREGTLATVNVAGETATIEDTRKFEPTARARDARLGDGIVWRGFDAADVAVDKAQKCHKVAPARYTGGSWSSGAWGGGSQSTSQKSVAALPAWSGDSKASTSTTSAKSPAQSRLFDDVHSGFDDSFDDDSLFPYDSMETIESASEEAVEAFKQWCDAGFDPMTLSLMRMAQMPSEILVWRDEYELSSDHAFFELRNLIDQAVSETRAC